MTKSAKTRLLAALSDRLRDVDFSWFDLEAILRRTMNQALKDTNTQIVDNSKKTDVDRCLTN